jgi:hypothetical protein
MVDELIGNIYEVVTKYAIESFSSLLREGESVFWHAHPPGVAVEPDLTIGPAPDSPRLLVLISHTNAERASEKKFWRNIGEYVDARLAMGNTVTIINVVFDSGQKRKLAAASSVLFDAFLEADRQPYGHSLLELCKKLSASCKNKAEDIRPTLVSKYISSRPDAKTTLRSFGKNLDSIVSEAGIGRTGWFPAFRQSISNRSSGRIPAARETSVRRAIGRLLPLETEEDLIEISKAIRSRKSTQLPAYFETLGLSRKSLRGPVIVDSEILEGINMWPNEWIRNTWIEARRSDSVLHACNQIICIGELRLYHSFITSKYKSLTKPQLLADALSDCFTSPNEVLSSRINLSRPNETGLWLFDYLMNVFKAHSGKQQGYGYSKLDRDAGTGLGTGIGPHLSNYVNRTRPLREDLLAKFSKAMSTQLETVGLSWLKENEVEIASFQLQALFSDKIYKNPKLDPLRVAITESLGHPPQELTRFPTFLTQFSGIGTATCSVFLERKTLILWQSASQAGVRHKINELCGRVSMLRVSYEDKNGAIPNPAFRKVILVIDGPWPESGLERLHASGVDEIYFPDEMAHLATAIV